MPDLAGLGQTAPPLVLIIAIGIVHARGRARRRKGLDPTTRTGLRCQFPREMLFYLGLLCLAIALSWPLDTFAARSLAAHMTQHVILMVLAPLLLVLAAPWENLVAGSLTSHRTASTGNRSPLTTPESDLSRFGWLRVAVAATVVQGLLMWVWHIPALYDWAVRTDGIHAIEHLSYIAVGIWFWWAVGVAGSKHNGIAALVVFIAALPGTALGAALMLAGHPWYPPYPDLQDQQVAGAIMWSVGGAAYLAGAVVVFITWLNRMEQAQRNDPARQELNPQGALVQVVEGGNR